MKKNLISILILALLVVNLVLTAIMMFSVTSSVKKTSALVTNIASILNIELSGNNNTGTEVQQEVSILDAEAYNIADELTIPLKKGVGEEKTHYCLLSVSFYMNTKHEDYESLSQKVPQFESALKNIIIDVVGSYTMDEAQSNQEVLKEEILKEVQNTFGSTFIYKVAFGKIMFQ